MCLILLDFPQRIKLKEMKFIIKKHLAKLSFVTLLGLAIGQTTIAESKTPLDSLDVTSKIEYIISNSNKYKEFKVIKKTWLLELKSQVADSLEVQEKRYHATQELIKSQQKEINQLKNTITETNTSLQNVNSEKDKIAFLGMPLEKSLYNMILWSLVVILLVSLLLFMMKFKSSNKETVETKKNYGSLDEEFEKYKKNTLDKEQKLKRQLQDEINKNNRLSNKDS